MASKKYKKQGGKYYEELGNEAEYGVFLNNRKTRLQEMLANLNSAVAANESEITDLEAEITHIDDELASL